ncbi:MAG TPA: CRISPR-associated primase-polymerase type A1 [Candidatus Cloacimonadota bacterium]|nr:CRISPR-associated primase-polymerase type A1 [Candidatus Cloacimonadota bacterium]
MNQNQNQTNATDSPVPQKPAQEFHLLRIKFNTAFLNEDFSAAEEVCRSIENSSSLSPSEREELSRYFLMLGKVPEALNQIDQVLETQAENHLLARKKSEILRLSGENSAARVFLENRLAQFPRNIEYYTEFLLLAEAENDLILRESILEKAKENSLDIAQLLPQQEKPAQATAGDEQQELYREADLLAFMNLFAGRENCHARQWVGEDGKHGYALVSEPLSIQLLRNHLLGIHTLGVYQLDFKNKVKWIMFDLDVDKSYLNDIHDPDVRAWIDAGLQKAITQLKSILAVYQIPSHTEFSGYKGYHVWILLEEKISASFARMFAQRIAAQVSLDGLPIHIEIFPKQTKISSSSYGNLVKLPYGLHRLSGLPSSMLADDGDLIPFQEFVKSPKLTSNQMFISALNSLDPNFNITRGISSQPDIEPKDLPDESGPPLPDPETDPEWLCLKQNCHALWVVDNLIKTRSALSADQKNVLKYTAGYLKQGPAIVNALLRKCLHLDPAELMKSGFKGNAVSCAKIRAYMADEIDTRLCNCDFSLAPGMYPTPILHLRKLSDDQMAAIQWNELKIKDLIASYLKLRKEFCDIQNILDQKERQIIAAFEEIGVDEISSPWGVLKKTTQDGSVKLTLNLK